PFQQRQPSAQADGDSRGELVRGSNDCQSRSVTDLLTCGDVDAFLVHWHRYEPRSGAQQRPTRSQIAGIFDPNQIARVEQHTRDRVEGALRSRRENDLLWCAVDAACNADMRGNRLAQREVALRALVERDGLQ